MGKTKRKFNWKSRAVVQATTDNSFLKNVKINIPQDKQSYDESNPFVLPSKKRKTTVKRPIVEIKKFLSKKKRRQLETVVKRKQKKENRSALLEELNKVQAPPEVISRLKSISEVQTKGLKRFLIDEKETSNIDQETFKKVKVNSIKGKNRTFLNKTGSIDIPREYNPNIVGFESSDDSDDSNDDEKVDEESTDENENKSNDGEHRTNDKSVDSKSSTLEKDNCIASYSLQPVDNNDEVVGDRLLTLQYIDENQKINVTNDAINDDISSLFNKFEKKEEELAVQIITTDKDETIMKNPDELDIDLDGDDHEQQGPSGIDDDGKSVFEVNETMYVPVFRKEHIEKARLKLPIIGEEQMIMETIKENQIVIITGETGSGKTTQVPQFLFEAGFAKNNKMIGITEPRRVAAISMSERVAEELNLTKKEVSYLIRFEGNAGPKTKIKFMTDGVLLKEIQKDFLLTRYSVIILDEAHERSVYTDILIGLLSRIVPLRCKKYTPLRLVIMSATLHIDEFKNNVALFKTPPPVISIDSRQYPVMIHFNKTTPEDYILAAFKKICKIHASLPEGGILVFVTGQQEVNLLTKKLRQLFCFTGGKKQPKFIENRNLEDELNYDNVVNKFKNVEADKSGKSGIRPIDDTDCDLLEVDDVDDDLKNSDDVDELEFTNIEHILQLTKTGRIGKMWVVPLYSILPSKEQAKVFQKPPPNHRLCVVATNIAETSLTIPNIKYVVDTGRTKVKLYEKYTGVSTYQVVWTSKASANQRAGRAGRTVAGHCYRLYSSAVFNDIFEEWSVPEIKRKPIDELVLQMKCLGIDYIKNFPFPSSPGVDQLQSAECRLVLLGALKPQDSLRDRWFTKLTKLGESMTEFAVAPRFAKMLCYSHQHNLLPLTVSIVAALAVPEVFETSKLKTLCRKWTTTGNKLLLGDVYLLHNACSIVEKFLENGNEIEQFCLKMGIRFKAVKEIIKLRVQLMKTINLHIHSIQVPITPHIPPPTDIQAYQLRQIVLMGMVDKVARKLDEGEARTADVSVNKPVYKLSEIDDIAYIHDSSVLCKVKPTWIVYQEAFEQNGRLYLRGITAIEPEWLPILADHLCYIPKNQNERNTFYDQKNSNVVYIASCTFGRGGWSLPAVPVPCPVSEETCRYFAKFFLEGRVCPPLKQFVNYLLSPPETVLKSWSSLLLPRTQALIKTLLGKGIYNGKKLFNLWKEDPKFLLDAYLEWLPKPTHNEVEKIWPPLP